MGIIQEKRPNVPQPTVENTGYGASYVKAAVETPVAETPQVKEEKSEESVREVKAPAVEEPRTVIEAVKRKGGRPRKNLKSNV